MYGCTRCRFHGGASPRAQAKKQERLEWAARLVLKEAVEGLLAGLNHRNRSVRLAVAVAVLEMVGMMSSERANHIEDVLRPTATRLDEGNPLGNEIEDPPHAR